MATRTLETPEQLQIAERIAPPRNTLVFLLCTVFLNALGITVIGPVLPFIVQQYVADADLASVIGSLTAIYAVCQFVAAPGLGVLSDRFGRRPLTLVCLLGSAIGYLVFGLGGALWVLFLGRIDPLSPFLVEVSNIHVRRETLGHLLHIVKDASFLEIDLPLIFESIDRIMSGILHSGIWNPS